MLKNIFQIFLIACLLIQISCGGGGGSSSTPEDKTIITAGAYHTLTLKNDGTLWVWGENYYGQHGNGTAGTGLFTSNPTPVQVGTDKWKNVSAGESHTIALRSDGTLWGWGYNAFGQAGSDISGDRHNPGKIGTDSDWAQIATGHFHNFALKNDGTLWGWGLNGSYYLLGTGTSIYINDTSIPVKVDNSNNWKQVSPDRTHSIAIKTDGTLWR